MHTKDKITAALVGNVAFIEASARKVETRAMKEVTNEGIVLD